MAEYLFSGGIVVDGSGDPACPVDILVRDQRILQVAPGIEAPAALRVDCSSLTLAPGFIDSHTHSDLQVLEGRTEKLRQGVTTEVVGNCGFSAYPPAPNPRDLRSFANGILCGDNHWGWPSTDAYLRAIEDSSTSNVVSLAGHGSLRIAVAGNRQGPLTEAELQSMEALLAEALQAGAAGFSTGLMYAPGSSAPTEELLRLCSVVARSGAVYTSHIRSYFSGLVDAVEEQIDLARRSGVRLQISHLQAVGASNWPLQQRAIDAIEQARAAGLDIEFDCYPYLAGSSVLTQVLPQSALDGGVEALMARLRDPHCRQPLREAVLASIPWRWSDIQISSVASEANAGAIAKSLEDIARIRGCEPVDALFDLLLEENADVNMLCFNQSQENLRASLTHPLATVISDGFYVKGRPHPRLHGTFPLLLGTVSRERGWLPLHQAVHKITGKPAARYGIKDRGLLRDGCVADIVAFRADHIDSPATYDSPQLDPVGIEWVLRNGRPASLPSARSLPFFN
jgi:dihydroorotase/N-acyl-D-amino-acid deacylase